MTIKRILHIVSRMDRAGAETMLMNLYREIDRSVLQFDFLCLTGKRSDFDDEIEQLGGRIIRIGNNNPASRLLLIWKTLQRGHWQVVHSHTLLSSGLHLLVAKFAGVPMLVAHSHSTSSSSNSIISRNYERCMLILLAWAPTVRLACGDAAANYLFPNNIDVQLLPNAIDICEFLTAKSAMIEAEFKVKSGQLIVLQVGRLSAVKNHKHSMRVAQALRDQGTDFQLWIVGVGPEQQALEEEVRDGEFSEQVRFLGLRDDIAELMSAADVMLMPSLHEGFPVVLVESQAAGLPALVADTISPEVDLHLGLVRFISLQASPKAWSTALKALSQYARHTDVSAQLRKQTLEQHGFSVRISAQRLTEVYSRL